MNLGELTSSFHSALDTIAAFNACLGFFPEARISDTALLTALAREKHVTYIAILRPAEDGTYTPNVGGSCVFLAFQSKARIVLLAQFPKGAASILVLIRDCPPFAVIGAYLPPASARRAHWRAEITQFITHEYERLRKRYFTIIVGDFNARAGPHNDRLTEDWHIPPYARPTSRLFCRWMDSLRISPVHGRTLNRPGRTTCRSPTGTGSATESDYILCDVNAPPTVISAGPTQSWSTALGAHGHRIVAVELRLGSNLTLERNRNSTCDAVTAPRIHLPTYNSRAWYDVAESISANLGSAAAELNTPDVSINDASDALNRALSDAATRHLTRPTASLRTTLVRYFNGIAVSTRVADALQQARTLRRSARRLHAHARRDADHDTASTLYARARQLQRSAKTAAAADARTWMRTRIRALEHARGRDPHALYRTLSAIAPADPLVHVSDEFIPPNHDGTPALETFRAHFERLLQHETQPPSAASLAPWLARLATADPDSDCTPLDAPLSPEEAYLHLFPADRMHDFVPPHGPGCELCDTYSAEFGLWQNGDLNFPPEWPCIKTSKATGPDGLPFEIVRWSRPEDPAARLQ